MSGLGVFCRRLLRGVPGELVAPPACRELPGDCFLMAKSVSMSLASFRRGFGFGILSVSVGEAGDTGVCIASLKSYTW